MLYRVDDSRNVPVGVFDTLDEAKGIVPEVTRWEQPNPGVWHGWRPDGSFWDGPHFTITAADNTQE